MPKQTKPEDRNETFRETWLPLIAMVVFFFACASAGFVALFVWGPAAGLAASLAGLALYVWLGPPPMPGLVPGILSIWMLGAAMAATLVSAVRLFR